MRDHQHHWTEQKNKTNVWSENILYKFVVFWNEKLIRLCSNIKTQQKHVAGIMSCVWFVLIVSNLKVASTYFFFFTNCRCWNENINIGDEKSHQNVHLCQHLDQISWQFHGKISIMHLCRLEYEMHVLMAKIRFEIIIIIKKLLFFFLHFTNGPIDGFHCLVSVFFDSVQPLKYDDAAGLCLTWSWRLITLKTY